MNTVAASCLMFLCLVAQVSAQESVQVIEGEPECVPCRIERYLVAELNDSAFPGVIRIARTAVTVTTDGRFLLGPADLPNPHVANARGEIVAAIGRGGEGPGEYRLVTAALDYGGGFLIYDGRLRRVTRLNRALEFQRVEAFPPIGGARPVIAYDNGNYVVNGTYSLSGAASKALHLVSPDGKVLRSFGPELSRNGAAIRLVARSRDGTVLVARYTDYRIERWDTAGRLLRVYKRDASWFPTRAEEDIEQDGYLITAIHEDRDGMLWVHMADYDAHPNPGVARMPTGKSIIEVLDLENARLVAAARGDFVGGDVVGAPYQWHYYETTTGEPRLRIWGFRLGRD